MSIIKLTDKTTRDWYLDFLIEKKIEVEFWDVVALVRESYEIFEEKRTEYLRTLRNYDDLEHMISLPENINATYIILATYAGFTIKLYRILSRHNCRMIFIAWGGVPAADLKVMRNVLYELSNPITLIKKIYNKVMAFLYVKIKLIRRFDIVFVAGQDFAKGKYYANKVVPINSPDFEQFKKVSHDNQPAILEESYAVFLDVNLPRHADLKVVGWPQIDSTKYFKKMNIFFEEVEKKYRLKVIIAAHPSADYRAFNPFNERKIFNGVTPRVVKDASFVISHSSNAQSQAILFQKPLMFVYTNEMLSAYKNTYMNEIYSAAQYLDACILNIDEISQLDQIIFKPIDHIRYEAYKYSFLTTLESEFYLNSDVFLREISTSVS